MWIYCQYKIYFLDQEYDWSGNGFALVLKQGIGTITDENLNKKGN